MDAPTLVFMETAAMLRILLALLAFGLPYTAVLAQLPMGQQSSSRAIPVSEFTLPEGQSFEVGSMSPHQPMVGVDPAERLDFEKGRQLGREQGALLSHETTNAVGQQTGKSVHSELRTANSIVPDDSIRLARGSAVNYVPGDGVTVTMLNEQSSLKLFGQFSAIGQFSTTRTFPAGGALFLTPASQFGYQTNTVDLHARQTSFGASFTGPQVFGFTPGAFFLGFIQNDSLSSDAYGFLPFNAYGELKNERWRIAAGLQRDVFNPLTPTMISLLNLFASGNTGSFRGQARAEHFLKLDEALQITTQVALSDPVSSIVTSNQRILEDNGWPTVEGRLAAGLGRTAELDGGRKMRIAELGVSGLVSQLRTSRLLSAPTDPDIPNRAIVDVWGLGLDGQWNATQRLGFAGELFIGQGLGEYNGGVLQSFNSTSFNPIRTRGGWGEAFWYFTDKLHLHVGYGVDAPIQRDLAASQLAKNQTYFTNLVWDPSRALQISFEVDYRKTDYIAFGDIDGVVFISQMLWRF